MPGRITASLLFGAALAIIGTAVGGLLLYDPAPQFMGSGDMMSYFAADEDVGAFVRCGEGISVKDSDDKFVEKLKDVLACQDAHTSPSYRAYLRSVETPLTNPGYGWNVAVGLGHVLGAEVRVDSPMTGASSIRSSTSMRLRSTIRARSSRRWRSTPRAGRQRATTA